MARWLGPGRTHGDVGRHDLLVGECLDQRTGDVLPVLALTLFEDDGGRAHVVDVGVVEAGRDGVVVAQGFGGVDQPAVPRCSRSRLTMGPMPSWTAASWRLTDGTPEKRLPSWASQLEK